MGLSILALSIIMGGKEMVDLVGQMEGKLFYQGWCNSGDPEKVISWI